MQIQEQFNKLILDRTENTTMFFTIEEAKEIVLDFWQRAVKVL